MKIKISILGSTGSIGNNLINLILKDKKKFKVNLLSTNKNYKKIINQAKLLKVKNLIIINKISYLKALKINKNKSIKIYNNFNDFKRIFIKKNDYVMSSISGLPGLIPTLNIIKHTKTIAIANKEAIICGWSLLKKELHSFDTKFIPVDSEHFSIWYALRNNNDFVDKVFLTASGGPFLNLPISKFKKISVNQALKHPNWKMGKKISIDSSTMMNKVFEVIEAKNIFDLKYNQLSILTHPYSYIHAIIQFKNGISKIIAHDTDMKIPISNTLYLNEINKNLNKTKINILKLNNLNLKKIDLKKFPLVKILKILPHQNSLFETVLVSANDELVNRFLKNDIKFNDIAILLIKLLNKTEFHKYKKITPNNIDDIIKLSNYVRLKIRTKSI